MRAGVGTVWGAGDGECFVSVGSCLMVGMGMGIAFGFAFGFGASSRGSDLALGSDIVGYGTWGSARGGTAAKTDGIVDRVVSRAGAVHPAIVRFVPRTSSASCGGGRA